MKKSFSSIIPLTISQWIGFESLVAVESVDVRNQSNPNEKVFLSEWDALKQAIQHETRFQHFLKSNWSTQWSENRKREWMSGRRCMLKLFGEFENRKWKPEECYLSMTHNADWTLAVGLWSPSTGAIQIHIDGFGLDLESSNRKHSDALERRTLTDDERALGMDFLQAWTAKEACLKSFPSHLRPESTLPKALVVTDFVLREWDPKAGTGRVSFLQDQEFLFYFRTLEIEGCTLSLAFSECLA